MFIHVDLESVKGPGPRCVAPVALMVAVDIPGKCMVVMDIEPRNV